MPATPRPAPRGFTLVELLVVVAIVGLISAVAIPVVLPALNERKVGEGARLLHAVLSGARDAAVRAGAPRGVRLLIDPVFSGGPGQPLASNRTVAIEPGPDYAEGRVRHPSGQYYPDTTIPDYAFYVEDQAAPVTQITEFYLRVSTSPLSGSVSNSPTGWTYNVRQGDRIRFNDSGNYYTIAGPIALPMPHKTTDGGTDLISASANNPERFIICPPLTTPIATNTTASLTAWRAEYLNLTNGIDDDGDGWIDESCDGIDNDGDGVIDPGFNGIDDNGNGFVDEPDELKYNANVGGVSDLFNEYEKEAFVGSQANTPPKDEAYTIYRRPVVSPGAREVSLPDGVVIDLTTWNASAATPGTITPTTIVRPLLPERSRLPVDPITGYVDILVAPNGQVVLPGVGGGGNFARTPVANSPFYHFWVTEREGVRGPLWEPASPTAKPTTNPNQGSTTKPQSYLLPMPRGTPNYEPMPNGATQNYSTSPVFLTGNRRLVTLFAKTGQLMTNTIETFDANDTNAPYYAAQSGIKEAQ